MGTRLNRETFLKSLEAVQSGLSVRRAIEQSDAFVFRNARVITFSDEVLCKGKSGLPKELTAAVPAMPLLTQLQKWTEDEIDVELVDKRFCVRGKGRGIKLNAEMEITLPIDSVEKPTTWLPLAKDFNEAVAVVGACASKDASHFPIDCLHLHPKWLEACTKFQVIRWRMKTGLTKPILVRPAAIKAIRPLGMTEFSESPAWLHFRNADGLLLSCRSYVEEFRDLSDLLECPEETAATLPKGLVQAAEKAQIFSKENGVEQDMVTVELKKDKLKITAVGISGEFWERKKISYDGPDMTFLISPAILADLVEKHTDCWITGDKLMVKGGSYKWCTWLGKTQNEESGE